MARGVAQTASEPDKLDIAIALFEQGFTEDRVEAALREKGTLEEAIQWLSGKTNDKMVHDNPRVEVSKTPSLCTGMFFAPCGEITTGTSTSSSSDPAACKKEDRSQEHALEETPIQDYADLVIPIEAKDARKWWRKAAARWPQIIADLQAQAATSIVRPPPVFTQAPAQETPKRKRPYPLEVPEEAGKQQAADNDDLTQPAKLARVDVCSPKTLPRVATPCASPHAMRLNRTCETCVICYNDAPQLRAVRLSCGHGWYCAQCVLRHAEARLSIGAADVSCPECNCALPERDLRKLLPPEFIDRLLARSLEQAVSSAADLWACPTPNCPMRVALEDGELPRLQCNVCGKSSCLRCGVQPYHKGSTCEEHAEKMRNRGKKRQQEEDSIRRWIKETGTQQCPTCRMAVTKQNLNNQQTQYSECHKMMCRNCNTKFCFKCLQVLTDTFTCGCTRKEHGFINPNTGKRMEHLKKRGRGKGK